MFLTPFGVLSVLEGILPATTFTHRHYEAIKFVTSIPSATAWYPNVVSEKIAVGDLCHHTKAAIQKTEHWITDQYGFRNDTFINTPRVVIIGDSFIQGSGLNQSETLANRMIAHTGGQLTVYSMAPSNLNQFDQFLQKGILKKPDWVIVAVVERNQPTPFKPYQENQLIRLKNLVKNVLSFQNFNVFLDKMFRCYSLKWAKARIRGENGRGIPGARGSGMFFLRGKAQQDEIPDLRGVSEIIQGYDLYCKSRGINFLFLPMPNKESVYFEQVPLAHQPKYLAQLDCELVAKEIRTINTLELYNEYRSQSSQLLYHLDDTHWNPTATDLVAKKILTLLKQDP
ncbi:MAG: hypothetical protein RRC34_10775 [Lentisphaeria bacterium]|nr:hypothetical protein [Lentisphaeria bacterium]